MRGSASNVCVRWRRPHKKIRNLPPTPSFLRNLNDVFTDGLISINVLAVPRREHQRFSFQNFVKIEIEIDEMRDSEGESYLERGYYLEEYTLTWKDTTAVIRQHGDENTCVR